MLQTTCKIAIFYAFFVPHLYIMPFYSHMKRISQDAIGYYLGENHLAEEDFIYLTELYNAELHYVDEKVKEIFEYLKGFKMLDNAMVIITSDHGEHIGEHKHLDHLFSIYEEIIHIPLIVKFPGGSTFRGKIEKNYFSLKDLVYLINEVLNGKLDPFFNKAPSSESECIFSLMSNQAVHFNISDCANRYKRIEKGLLADKFAVVHDGYKFIKNGDNNYELYNIKDDSEEVYNLKDDASSLAKKSELELVLNNWLKEHSKSLHNQQPIDDRMTQKLEALGYM